jgi:hypothetical protein
MAETNRSRHLPFNPLSIVFIPWNIYIVKEKVIGVKVHIVEFQALYGNICQTVIVLYSSEFSLLLLYLC